MPLTPTDRDEHFFKAMVDAADGSTPEELQPTERREHWYKEIIDAIAAGGGGSGGGVLVVHDVDGTLDKTWQEIHDAMFVGGAVIQFNETNVDHVLSVYTGKGSYFVSSQHGGEVLAGGERYYTASSASDYPTSGS